MAPSRIASLYSEDLTQVNFTFETVVVSTLSSRKCRGYHEAGCIQPTLAIPTVLGLRRNHQFRDKEDRNYPSFMWTIDSKCSNASGSIGRR